MEYQIMDYDRTDLPNAECYQLIIDEADGSPFYSLSDFKGNNRFTNFCLDRCSKIYMLISQGEGNKICYIGQTIYPMPDRFYRGFNADRKYDWASEKGIYYLLVWDLSKLVGEDSPTKDSAKKNVKNREGIESELTFLAKVYQTIWPRYQTSINFHYGRNISLRFDALPIAINMMVEFFNFIRSLPENQSKQKSIDAFYQEFVNKLEVTCR